MLSERATNVLNILVDQYVRTAAPVASEDVARLSQSKVSPATVRSAMSQLTEEGYISRPHVSAGGIPTDLAYRHYVEAMTYFPPLPLDLRRQIDQRFDNMEPHVEVWTQQCASILSRLTASLAIVTVPQAQSPRLRRVQLVNLQEFLALLIIVLQEARLLRRLLTLNEGVDQAALDHVANTLNDNLNGLTSDEINSSTLDLTPLAERVKRDSADLMREAGSEGPRDHSVDGLRQLLGQPEFSGGERAKEIIEIVEERILLDTVLSEVPPADEVGVYIGGENQHSALQSYSVVVCGYGIPGQFGGTICVIGPTRMGYTQAISGVRYLSSVMNQLVEDFHSSFPIV